MESITFGDTHRIVRRLGLGRTSEVLLAVARGPFGFERAVVIKRLLAKIERDSEAQRVLVAEALAHARLSHPSIVRLYDFVWADEHLELIMEYVDGVSLARLRTMLRVQGESIGDGPALYIASRIFAALAAAHGARDPRTGEFAPVIHRDVSPGNVLVPWDGFVKIGDFGLAKVTGFVGDTRVGMIKGTFGYMAPEQVLGEPVTPRTDVYAGCLVLREMLLGRPTFVRGDLPELEFIRTMAEPRLAPIEQLRGGISPAVADALRRGLAPHPDDRALTAEEMVGVLRAETDLSRAHDELVEKLARVRPGDESRSSEQRTTPHLGIPVTPSGSFGIRSTIPEPRELASRPRLIFDTPSTMSLPAAIDSGPLPQLTIPEVASLDLDGPSEITRFPRSRTVIVALGLAAALVVAVGVGRVLGMRSADRASAGAQSVAVTSGRTAARPHASDTRPTRAAPLPKPLASAAPAASAAHAPLALPEAPRTSASVALAPAPALAPARQPERDRTDAAVVAERTGEILTPSSASVHRVFLDGAVVALHSGVTLKVACGPHVIRIGSHGAAQSISVPCGGAVTVK